MPAKTKSTASAQSTATIGFEAKLWLAAGKIRNNMDAAEQSGANRVVRDSLLKAARRVHAGACGKQTAAGSPQGERGGANQYKAENVFWVPAEARWSHLQANAKQPEGKAEVRMQKEEPHLQLHTASFSLHTWPDATVAIDRDNPRLKGVLPKDYVRPGLDTARRDSAFSKREATPQSLSEAKDNHRSQRRRLPNRRAVVADFATVQTERRLNP